MVYLSICIPTYNRKSYLQKTIDSIVSQPFFQSGEVEIIVSDNASVDGTEEMMRLYTASAPNIRYFRNETNEGVSINIYKALNLGTGLYRKVSNDTYIFKDGSLGRMVECIKKNELDRPFILFSNEIASCDKNDTVCIDNLDQLVKNVSYNLTNDTVLGFWESELSFIQNVNAWFWTIRAIFKIINIKSKLVIYNFELYSVALVKNKDLTYGLIPVFYTEYLKCYEPYIGKEIKLRTYRQEKGRLLYGFFLLWLFVKETSNNYRFSSDDNVQNLRKAYGSPLILFSILLKLKVLKKKIRSLLHR